MNRTTKLMLCLAAAVLACILDATTFSGQPPLGRTGAPGEQTCHTAGCHNSIPLDANSSSILLQNISGSLFSAGFEGGTTYNLSFTNSFGSPVYGFQLTAVDLAGNAGGTLSIISGNPQTTSLNTAGGRQYVSHNNANATNAWPLRWTAPLSGPDTVVFYVASNAANGDGGDGGDRISINSYPVFRKPPVPDGACEDIFISEYIEGSGFNKAIELYNPTNSAIDLSNYIFSLFRNGSSTVLGNDSDTLSGTIQPFGTYVIAGPGSAAALLAVADLTLGTTSAGPLSFNGDDALLLTTLNGDTVDIIGQIGLDPGSAWGSGATSTANRTLVRKAGIRKGLKNSVIPYNPSVEWDGYAQDMFDSLGVHFNACMPNFCSNFFSADVDAVVPASCNGAADGLILYTVNNGSGSYQFSGPVSGLAAGTYAVVVQDTLAGCVDTLNFTITEPDLLAVTLAMDSASIFGAADGSITATVTGGTPPYQFSIDTGGTFQTASSPYTFSGLAAGAYSVLVQDANACTTTGTITVLEPADVTVSAVQDSASCAGLTDGSITITAAGGTPPYQYSIDGGNTLQASNVFTGLGAGVFTVYAEGFNGDTATTTITVLQPAALSISFIQQNVSCFGGNNGYIVLTAAGGTQPYEYSVDNGTTYQVSDSFPSLTAGFYTSTIRDANGCLASGLVTLTQPVALTGSVAADSVSCNGLSTGSITASALGGTPPYRYSINGGASFQSSPSFTGLAAGPYTVTIVDTLACSVTLNSAVGEPAVLAVNTFSQNVSCQGTNDGKAWVSVSGGTAPYTYAWTTGVSVTDTAANLTQGNWGITVTDARGCSQSQTINVGKDVLATQPAAITGTDTLCIDGTSYTFATTAVSGITYTWAVSGGGTITGNGSSAAYTPSSAGTFTISVTPSNGCGNGTAQTRQVFIFEPTQPQLQGDTVTCVDDVLTYTVTNPNAFASYSWSSTSGTVTGNGTSATASWDVDGNYTISVDADYAKCTATTLSNQLSVRVRPELDASFTYTIDSANVVTFTNTSTGLTVNETYVWEFGNGDSSLVENPVYDFGTTVSATYQVSLLVSGDCNFGVHTESVTITAISTGISVAKLDELEVYPNPTTDWVSINWPPFAGELTARVINTLGTTVLSETNNALTGKLTLQVASLPEGMYLLVLDNGQERYTTKLVKN